MRKRGILHEGLAPDQALMAQCGRRTTVLTLDRFAVVDASGTKEQVHTQVRAAVLPFLTPDRVEQ